jgi:dsDNA-specific endonuclease/ATPase MutS2
VKKHFAKVLLFDQITYLKMHTKRRKVIASLGITISLAGCTGDVGQNDDGNNEDEYDVDSETINEYESGLQKIQNSRQIWENASENFENREFNQASQQYEQANTQFKQAEDHFISAASMVDRQKAAEIAEQAAAFCEEMGQSARKYSDAAELYESENPAQADELLQEAVAHNDEADSIGEPLSITSFRGVANGGETFEQTGEGD